MENLLIDPEFIRKNFEKTDQIAKKSPCKKKKVGAVVYTLLEKPQFISAGYNRPPKGLRAQTCATIGCVDIVHAEVVALVEALKHSQGPFAIYVNLEPCFLCAKFMIEANVKYVFFKNEHKSRTSHGSGREYLVAAGVKVFCCI